MLNCIFVPPEGCNVAPGKKFTPVPGDPPTTKAAFLYVPSPYGGGVAGIAEKCPTGSWVTKVKMQTATTGKDKMGIVGG